MDVAIFPPEDWVEDVGTLVPRLLIQSANRRNRNHRRRIGTIVISRPATPAPPHEAASAASDRRNHTDDRFGTERRSEAVEAAALGVLDKHVDEAPEIAVGIKQPLLEIAVGGGKEPQRFAEAGSIHLHLAHATRERTKGVRNTDGGHHETLGRDAQISINWVQPGGLSVDTLINPPRCLSRMSCPTQPSDQNTSSTWLPASRARQEQQPDERSAPPIPRHVSTIRWSPLHPPWSPFAAATATSPVGVVDRRHFAATLAYAHRMDLERRNSDPAPSGRLPLPAKIALGGLALFGAVTLVQWVLVSTLRFIRFGLFVVIVIALIGWALNAKANR